MLDFGTEIVAWQTPAQRHDIRHGPYGRFMSKPRAISLLLMAAGVCAYGTAPDWLAMLVGLLGLAATLLADRRYLRLAMARRHFRFLIDRAILLTALAVVATMFLFRVFGTEWL
jgi:hypothetical protein